MSLEIPATDETNKHWPLDLQASHVFRLYKSMISRRLGRSDGCVPADYLIP